mgnify:CR=1 FL=1
MNPKKAQKAARDLKIPPASWKRQKNRMTLKKTSLPGRTPEAPKKPLQICRYERKMHRKLIENKVRAIIEWTTLTIAWTALTIMRTTLTMAWTALMVVPRNFSFDFRFCACSAASAASQAQNRKSKEKFLADGNQS